jgi:hypothetical protein
MGITTVVLEMQLLLPILMPQMAVALGLDLALMLLLADQAAAELTMP